MRWIFVALMAAFMAFLPVAASADDGKDNNGFLLRIRGDVTVPAGETLGSVVVIDGNLTLEGTVENSVTVINGTAVVTGTVGDNLTVISGTLDLRSGAHVDNVNAVRSDVLRADGVTVTGNIHQRDGFAAPAGVIAAFSIFFWVAMTIAVVAAGLIFAAVGGRQLDEAAHVMTGDAVNGIIGTVFLWIAVPLLAVVVMLSLIGIPLGIGILVFLLPAMWFLGYIVAGTWLGTIFAKRAAGQTRNHPFAATTLGVVLLQLGILVPVLGAFVALLAGVWGAGSLAFVAFRAAGGKGFGPTTTTPAGATPAPAV